MKLQSINPYNQQPFAEYEEFSDHRIQQVLDQSVVAFKFWRKVPIQERAEKMRAVADRLLSDKQKLSVLISTEMGKPIREAEAEIEKCAWICEYYAEHTSTFLQPEVIKTDAFISRVEFEALGIILGIMPWNYPFWQVFRFIAPTLMAGNVCLLKHASNVQGCALAIEKLFSDADFFPGVFTTLVMGSSKVKSLIEDSRIKAVTLTGSEQAGVAVAAVAGRSIKKSVLELGGNNAFIVLEDADLNKAAEIGVAARMMNAGQSCIAAKRFFVRNEILHEFTQVLVKKLSDLKTGDPLNPSTEIGPLAGKWQADEVENQVNASLALGAKVLCGGYKNGAFYAPTVLSDVKPGMPVFEEEVFGPVIPIMAVDSDWQAAELSNLSSFGLGVSIITNNIERALSLTPLFDDGAVFVNSLVKSDPRLPFGGTKKSGYGRELSRYGQLEFVNVKTIYVKQL